jgi:hypothetical protein
MRGQDVCECGHERWLHGLRLGARVTQPCRETVGEWRGVEVPCDCKDFNMGAKKEVKCEVHD